MITLAKGSAAVASVLVTAAASIVLAMHGHTGTGAGVTSTVANTGGRGHRHHHGHHGSQGAGGGTGSSTGTGSGSGTGSGGSGHTQPGDPQAGKSSQPVNHGLLHPLTPIHTPVFWKLPVVTSLPAPSGTIGDPGVPCLMGYVWRQAYSGVTHT